MRGKFKVAITGTHHTGKTTFVQDLAAKLTEGNIACARVTDLASEARSKGFPILRDHTFDSTAWIIARGIALELEAALEADVVLVDRPVADALGYLKAALLHRSASLLPSQNSYLNEVVRLHSSTYDKIYFSKADPNFAWDDSKDRDRDMEFRQMAETGINQVLGELNIPAIVLPSTGRGEVIQSLVAEIASAINR